MVSLMKSKCLFQILNKFEKVTSNRRPVTVTEKKQHIRQVLQLSFLGKKLYGTGGLIKRNLKILMNLE